MRTDETFSSAPGKDLVVGVASDTHVPDRVNALHPDLLAALRSAGVALILHPGDVSAPSTLTELSRVAPVLAVRGNRDWLFLRDLPKVRRLTLNGVPAALVHGHGEPGMYLDQKAKYAIHGYAFEYFAQALYAARGEARLVVFGHTHYPENRQEDGCLYFNPGSACFNVSDGKPSFGLLRISASGQISAESVPLSGYKLKGRKWKKI